MYSCTVSKHNSHFLFVKGYGSAQVHLCKRIATFTDNQNLLTEAEGMLRVKEGDSVVIPCRPTVRNISVTLMKSYGHPDFSRVRD